MAPDDAAGFGRTPSAEDAHKKKQIADAADGPVRFATGGCPKRKLSVLFWWRRRASGEGQASGGQSAQVTPRVMVKGVLEAVGASSIFGAA